MPRPRQVFAFSGLLQSRPGERARTLVDHAVGLAGDGRKRVCFLPTAVGDDRMVIESVSELFSSCPDIDFSVLTLFTQPSVPLGFLPYSNGVHDDLDDQPRRSIYREYVAQGVLAAGYATEDGVGLHYVGTELHEAITPRRI